MASSNTPRAAFSLWNLLSGLFLSQILLLRLANAASCYWPNGSPASSDYVSCNGTAGVSSCCSNEDSCSTSGMCVSRHGYIYRGGCTDATWNADACPKLCRTARPDTWTALWTCPLFNMTYAGTQNYNYCCGEMESCCQNKVADRNTLDIGFSFTAGTDRTVSNLTQDLASIGGGGNGTAANASMCSESDHRLRTTLGVGLGVPFAISLIALAIVSFLFVKERRHRNLYRPDQLVGSSPIGSTRSGPEMTQRTYGSDTGPSIDGSPTATNQPLGRMDTVNHTLNSANTAWLQPGMQHDGTTNGGLTLGGWAGAGDTALPSMQGENQQNADGIIGPRRQPTSNGRGWIRPPASDETLSPASAGAENGTMETAVAPPPAELGSDSQPERAELWGSEKK